MINSQNIRVFISYRNIKYSKMRASELYDRLTEAGYTTFIDTEELKGGDTWRGKIYENIRNSDVLLVLLEPTTANSEWVQREVDMARGCHVSILPLRISEEELDIGDVQEKLALSETQYSYYQGEYEVYDGKNPKTSFEHLIESIERLSKQTRDNQKTWMKNLELRRHTDPAENNQVCMTYAADNEKISCKIHLATGDMTRFKDIDVFVNSENDYMQMARIFETSTLSSALRREGAYIKRGRMIEDTVQHELDRQIENTKAFCGRPIMMGQVIPTPAGHPKSNLCKNNIRYIFHVATVRMGADMMNENLTPIESSSGLRNAVKNCLEMVHHVNEHGLTLEEETDDDKSEQKKSSKGTTKNKNQTEKLETPIKSIAFPLFGTGVGGRSALEVAPPMVEAIYEFLDEHTTDSNPTTLEHVYLVVYSKSDIPFVHDALRTHKNLTVVDEACHCTDETREFLKKWESRGMPKQNTSKTQNELAAEIVHSVQEFVKLSQSSDDEDDTQKSGSDNHKEDDERLK